MAISINFISIDRISSEVMADTGIGRTVETVLGIPMNDSKQPDYKGIELKSKREKSNVRSNLFTQSPNWPLSRLKSGKAIVERYGYISVNQWGRFFVITFFIIGRQAPEPLHKIA